MVGFLPHWWCMASSRCEGSKMRMLVGTKWKTQQRLLLLPHHVSILDSRLNVMAKHLSIGSVLHASVAAALEGDLAGR